MKYIYAKVVTLVLSVFLLGLVSNGQERQTAEDYLESSQSYIRKGELDTALQEINKAIELKPDYLDAYFVRAAIRNKQKDTEGVLADYNKIVELDPLTFRIEVVYVNRSSIFLQKGEIDKALQDA